MAWSICVMASPTWLTPELCSRLAALISPTMSVTRRMLFTTSCMVVPARSTSCAPCSARCTLSVIRPLISLAAEAERCARVRTSPATTAKPRPCSPARAASTAAFSARMLVWKAMPSMTPMMSWMRCEAVLISRMVLTTSPTTSPPCAATALAFTASWLACCALSAFWRTVAVICSMEAAVCSRALAWLSVRADRSWLPWAISLLAVATPSALRRTSVTMRATLSRMACTPCSTLSWCCTRGISTPRLPCAICWAMALSVPGSAPSWRRMLRLMSQLAPTSRSSSTRVTPAACSSRSMNTACTLSTYTPDPITQPQGANPFT